MAKLTIYRNGKPISAGLECSIHWEGYSNFFGRGHTKLHTDSEGAVYIDDDIIRSDGSTPEKIWIDNPEGGYALYFQGITLHRGEEYNLHIELANHQ